jgi:biotin operon repressor
MMSKHFSDYLCPTPRTPQDFGDLLWSGYSRGYVAVASCSNDLTNDFHHRWSTLSASYGLMNDAMSLSRHRDVYFPVASFKNKQRKCDEVQTLKWLWADLDGHPLTGDIPEPTLLTQTSAGRFQALWRLAGNPDTEAVEERVRAIAFSCDLGNETVSANQILRIPGTINHKPDRNNYLVRVEEYRPKAKYRLEDFAHLAPGPVPLGKVEGVDLISPEESFSLWHGAYHKLSRPMRYLAYRNEVVKADGKAYTSPSEGDAALITALERLGYSPSQAGGIFLISSRGKWCVERHGKVEARLTAAAHAANAAQLIAQPQPPISIPSAMFNTGLVMTDVAAFAIQSAHSFGNQRTWYGQEKIADCLSLDDKTVAASIGRLREKGFLVPDGKVQRANRYRMREGDVSIPVSTAQTILERTNGKGLAVSLGILAGYSTNSALASALTCSRQHISPIADQLMNQGIITATVEARGLNRYAISQML